MLEGKELASRESSSPAAIAPAVAVAWWTSSGPVERNAEDNVPAAEVVSPQQSVFVAPDHTDIKAELVEEQVDAMSDEDEDYEVDLMEEELDDFYDDDYAEDEEDSFDATSVFLSMPKVNWTLQMTDSYVSELDRVLGGACGDLGQVGVAAVKQEPPPAKTESEDDEDEDACGVAYDCSYSIVKREEEAGVGDADACSDAGGTKQCDHGQVGGDGRDRADNVASAASLLVLGFSQF